MSRPRVLAMPAVDVPLHFFMHESVPKPSVSVLLLLRPKGRFAIKCYRTVKGSKRKAKGGLKES